MGDWSANEHLNSQTGENLGFQLQGWNAALFGLVYYGLTGEGPESSNNLFNVPDCELSPNIHHVCRFCEPRCPFPEGMT